jgi:hypothetical protein
MNKRMSNLLVTACICLSLGTVSTYGSNLAMEVNGSKDILSLNYQDTIPRNPSTSSTTVQGNSAPIKGSTKKNVGASKTRGAGTSGQSGNSGTRKGGKTDNTMGESKSDQNSDNRGEGATNNRSGNKKSTSDSSRRG